jgi:hypothetical protein
VVTFWFQMNEIWQCNLPHLCDELITH